MMNFVLKNLGFLLKNLNFLLKSVDFRLKNVDFLIIKTGDAVIWSSFPGKANCANSTSACWDNGVNMTIP